MYKYTVQLVWNREFNWVDWTEADDLEVAKDSARSILESGDGARVKKVQIIETVSGDIVLHNHEI